MYLLVLLGLLGTFEMNFYGGTKTQFEKGTGTEMCPSIFVWFSSPTFCPIFYPIPCPIVSSKFLIDLSSDFFLRFSGPISCSSFCPIVRIPVWYFVRFPVGYLSNFLSDLLPILLSDFLSNILSDISSYFLVRFFEKRRERVWMEGLNG